MDKRLRQLFIATLLFVPGMACADTPAPIDRSFTYKMDILQDAAPADVTLRVMGASIRVPFKWSITIADAKGRVVLFVQEDDGPDDTPWFKGSDLIKDCQGYEACKNKWYFKDLPETIPQLGDFVKRGKGKPVQDWQERSLQSLADVFLKQKGLNKPQRQAVIQEMHDLMERGGYGEFSPIRNPVSQGALYMYVPSLGYFVPFWED